MSFAIGHFSVGAALTILIVYLVRPSLPYPRTVMLAGGIWATLPDVNKLSPVYRAELTTFHDSAFANLFWGHRYIDVLDVGDDPMVSAVAVAFLFVVTVLVETHALWRVPRLVDVRAATAGSQYALGVKRVAAVGALAVGGVMVVAPFLSDQLFLGLRMGSGTILGLAGLTLLYEDVALSRFAVRVVPGPVRTGTKFLVTLGAGAFAVALLSTVPLMNDLSVPYGVLALIILLQLVHLWTTRVLDVGANSAAPTPSQSR